MDKEKLSLMFIGTLLSTCFVLGGFVYMFYEIPIRWIGWIITIIGPIGFTCLGYFTKTKKREREASLLYGVLFMTGYFVSIPFMSLITRGMPEEYVLNFLESMVCLCFFILGAPIGGIMIGSYLRLIKDD